MLNKEKVKYFNIRFISLKYKIHVESLPTQNLIITYYVKDLPYDIAMWVKRAQKPTLPKAFEEAFSIEKDILSLKPSSNK